MATKVTRDHHLLTRNLKLNGNYISNDGDDEGISIADNGKVTIGALITNQILPGSDTLAIDRNASGDGAGDATTLHVDFDRTVATSGTAAHNDIGIDLDVNSASLGTSSAKGMDIDVVGATSGTHTVTGIDITTSGGDKNFGLKINNEDNTTTDGTEADLINYSSANTSNYFYMNTEANGETILGTLHSGGSDGNIKLAPNGKLQIHSGSGLNPYAYFDVSNPYSRLRILGYNQDDDYLQIDVAADGETTISTVDDAGMDADLTLDVDGDIILDSDSGYVYLKNNGVSHGYLGTITGSKLKLGTSTNYELLLTTAGTGDIVLDAGGHVEFDGCAVGFDLITETFSSDVLANGGSGTGGTHDTDIDFRKSNKIYLVVTATMNDMNLIFPATSGNFLLNVRCAGDHAIDSWKVWKSDASAATGDNVFWPGGTEPDTTNAGRDIFSFYWDADNEICYGVASLDFQEGN